MGEELTLEDLVEQYRGWLIALARRQNANSNPGEVRDLYLAMKREITPGEKADPVFQGWAVYLGCLAEAIAARTWRRQKNDELVEALKKIQATEADLLAAAR